MSATEEPSLGTLSLRVLDHISAMVAYWDCDQRCRFANQAYLQWFGRSREQLLGTTMKELLGPIYPLNLPYILGALRGEPQIFERTIPAPSGILRHSIATYTPDIIDGVVRGFFVHVADVSPLKAAQEEMKKAQQAAEAASRAKSVFLAHMSHEIRTPMNAILGLMQLMRHTPLDPQQEDYLRKITTASRSLLGIIDDILDFSKAEAGKLVLGSRELALDEFLEELASIMAATVDKPEIEIAFQVAPEVPRRLVGDPGRLRQVLVNLTRNAVRFTDRGEIVLRVSREAAEPAPESGSVTLRFSVSDTGIGIPAEHLERIFEGFDQVDGAANRSAGGTGLGLTISRMLVRMMGGELRVDSVPGRGSTFHFSIPLGVDEKERLDAETPSAPGPGLRVLGVCSGPLLTAFLTETCGSSGWDFVLSQDAAAAAAQLDSASLLGKPFDVILLNWPLNERDESGLARLLGALGRPLAPASVLLVEQLYETPTLLSRRDSFDETLGKPVTASALRKAVERARAHRAAARGASPGGPQDRAEPAQTPQRLPGIKLLLVDDNPINLEVACGLFTKEGCLVTAVSSGPAALATLRAEPTRFDAVLMDVQMPEMDGYQTTHLIRTDLNQDDLPIIAVSAGVLWEERDKCRAAGMNGFISKPLDLDEAVLLLDSLLASAEGHRAAAQEEPQEGAPGPGAPSTLAPFDLSVAFGADGYVAPMWRSLMKLFLEDNVAMMSSIRAGIESGALRGAAGALHRLRGTAAVLGATRLAEATRRLEAQLVQSGPPDTRPALAEYESALKEALEAAHSFLVHSG